MKLPRNIKKKLLLILLGLSLGVVIAELSLRIFGFSFPLFYTTDYYRGYALQPNAAGLYQREGQNYVRINSVGLRDREHSLIKPPDVVRIAVIGDSYAEALQVPIEQTFWWRLQEQLEQCNAFPGRRVEVINFGVSGYGTAQELITLRQQAWDYSPDIVLLLVTTNNDISDNLRDLKGLDEIPYFVYQNGQLVADDSFRNSTTYRKRSSSIGRFGNWIHNHVRVIQLIHYVQLLAKERFADWRNRRKTAPTQAGPAGDVNAPVQRAEDISIENQVYLEPLDENWKAAWRIAEGLIREMRDEVRAKGAKFLLVVGSNAIQVHPDQTVRLRFLNYLGTNTIFYPNVRLKSLAEREPIDFLDLAQPMQEYAGQNKVFLHGFGSGLGNGHWNIDGHKIAAELIANHICTVGPTQK